MRKHCTTALLPSTANTTAPLHHYPLHASSSAKNEGLAVVRVLQAPVRNVYESWTEGPKACIRCPPRPFTDRHLPLLSRNGEHARSCTCWISLRRPTRIRKRNTCSIPSTYLDVTKGGNSLVLRQVPVQDTDQRC